MGDWGRAGARLRFLCPSLTMKPLSKPFSQRALPLVGTALLGVVLGACVRQANSPQNLSEVQAQGANPGGGAVGQRVPEASAPVRNADDLRQLSTTYAQIASQVTPAVVNIDVQEVVDAQEDPYGGFDGGQQVRQGTGSGVIVDGSGIILTNNHVVGNASQIAVTLTDRRRFTARVLGTDRESDLAVVKIDAKSPLPTLKFADSDKVRVGDIVLAVGSPLGLASSVTQGIISAKGRHDLKISQYEDFLQTDAAINPGNSGGALVDITGRLVGINTAILSQSGGNQGIGLSIPSNLVSKIASQLRTKGHVTRGYVGMQTVTVTADIAQQVGLTEARGVLVTGVERDGPAGNLPWVRRGGNVVLSVNGAPLDSDSDLRNAIANQAPGSTIKLEVRQPDGTKTFNVKVGTRPTSR